MNTLELLGDLLRQMEWADAIVWRAVLDTASAFTDPVIKGRLHHSHMVQRAFLNAWLGVQHTSNAGSDLSLPELAQWAREYHVLASEYLTTLTEDALDQQLILPWAKFIVERLGHDPAVTSLGETVLQVAAHSTYHRGQINSRLRELGAEPPLTDYIAWIWLGRPTPQWPVDIEQH